MQEFLMQFSNTPDYTKLWIVLVFELINLARILWIWFIFENIGLKFIFSFDLLALTIAPSTECRPDKWVTRKIRQDSRRREEMREFLGERTARAFLPNWTHPSSQKMEDLWIMSSRNCFGFEITAFVAGHPNLSNCRQQIVPWYPKAGVQFVIRENFMHSRELGDVRKAGRG